MLSLSIRYKAEPNGEPCSHSLDFTQDDFKGGNINKYGGRNYQAG